MRCTVIVLTSTWDVTDTRLRFAPFSLPPRAPSRRRPARHASFLILHRLFLFSSVTLPVFPALFWHGPASSSRAPVVCDEPLARRRHLLCRHAPRRFHLGSASIAAAAPPPLPPPHFHPHCRHRLADCVLLLFVCPVYAVVLVALLCRVHQSVRPALGFV